MLDDYRAAVPRVITSHSRQSMSNAISGTAVWLEPHVTKSVPKLAVCSFKFGGRNIHLSLVCNIKSEK